METSCQVSRRQYNSFCFLPDLTVLRHSPAAALQANKPLNRARHSLRFLAGSEIKSYVSERVRWNFVTGNGLTVTQVLRAIAASVRSPILQLEYEWLSFVTGDIDDRQWCAMQAKIDRDGRADDLVVRELTTSKSAETGSKVQLR